MSNCAQCGLETIMLLGGLCMACYEPETEFKHGLNKKDEKYFLKLIEEKWLHYWMDQTQNSEEDRKNYFSRAIGVDANMRYHLARLLAEDYRGEA